MCKIEVVGRCKKKYKLLAKLVAENVIRFMKFPENLEVVIMFVSRRNIRKLNRDFREIDRVTDVLSFPSFELKPGEILDIDQVDEFMFKEDNFVHFGDMAICLKQTKKQAKEFGVTVEAEIKKLVIHSMLHLMGYDHIKDDDYLVMKEHEEKLDKMI